LPGPACGYIDFMETMLNHDRLKTTIKIYKMWICLSRTLVVRGGNLEAQFSPEQPWILHLHQHFYMFASMKMYISQIRNFWLVILVLLVSKSLCDSQHVTIHLGLSIQYMIWIAIPKWIMLYMLTSTKGIQTCSTWQAMSVSLLEALHWAGSSFWCFDL
jgi:hypothetical protein